MVPVPPFRPLVTLAALLALLSSGCKPASKAPAPDPERVRHLQGMSRTLEVAILRTEAQTNRLAAAIADACANLDSLAASADRSAYRLEPNGVLHRPEAVARGVPAVFVSGVVPVGEEILRTVLGTEAVDPVLREVVETNEEVVQSYYNDRNSYNRIYPPFDVLTQYPPGMNIPEYNFYYLADARHNPERRPVWVRDPYVDPAGRGWMVSCVAPVYVGDLLEGVAGLDITVESIVRSLDLEGGNELVLLISEDGTVVAAGELTIRILRLPPLKNHRYVDTVRSDTFRSEDYNLRRSSSLAIRQVVDRLLAHPEAVDVLEIDRQRWQIHSVPVPRIQWRLWALTEIP